MSPSKKNRDEVIIDSIAPEFSKVGNNLTRNRASPFFVRELQKEKRTNILHAVIHMLAFFIVIPYIFMIIWGIDIPKEYTTIVSIVIGFYFGKSIFDRNQ
ncbi:MAG: hypothetical protein Q8N63_02570 [Nanoarchaeota archaeon]|nr:hypothetical protein [Nanoarchaeota archaeon]